MEFLLFVVGMIALLGARVVITSSIALEGDKARIFGGFLVAPWVIAFASGAPIGGADPTFLTNAVNNSNGTTGFWVFWGCVSVALLYALSNIWKAQKGENNFQAPANNEKKQAPRKAA
ncbi:MAG: hypothetical protein ACYTF7_04815 [Planctomycetota bacterium]|jgi:hypothetical protein